LRQVSGFLRFPPPVKLTTTILLKRLLSESELTLTNTVEISVAMETAAKDASDLQGSAQAGQVNTIKMAKSKQTVQFSSSYNK
jgi:hypothetical protein